MKKAFAYLRVSGKGQIDGDGFDRQEETIREYAESNEIKVVKVFREEGVSGTKGEVDRPAFQEMVSEILKNGVRTVIIEGLDRLAREYRIQETLLIYLASKNITLISARTQENITDAIMSDPMRLALVQIQGVFSQLEKSLLVKKLRVARERKKAATGKCEGRKGYIELMPEVIKEIKRLRRKRKGMPKRTYKQVAEELNRTGFKTLSGNVWTGQAVQDVLRKK
jgi:DNA invertase Pin-like site-specific DNA recombinase